MPRKPRKRRGTTAMTYQQILCLIERKNRIPGQHFRDENHRKEAWRNNKSAIMALQGQPLEVGKDSAALQQALHRDIWFQYFERPMAFYEYDRCEILGGHPDKRTLFFIERTCCGVEYDAEIDQAPKNAVIYKNEKEYLIKNDLLNAAEKQLLKAENAK